MDPADSRPARHEARRIQLEGAPNFRDLGGLPVDGGGATRRGVLYRSDSLAELTDGDLAQFTALGIRTVFDLRTEDERRRAPNRLPSHPLPTQVERGFLPASTYKMFAGVNERRFSANDARQAMHEQYRRLALDHGTTYRDVIHGLLDAGSTPALFHCTSGKDRTGILAALILSAVGVLRAHVVADYVFSNRHPRQISLFASDADPDVIGEVMTARAEYLEVGLLAIVDAFGSLDAYLEEALELTAARRRALCTLLVDTAV